MRTRRRDLPGLSLALLAVIGGPRTSARAARAAPVPHRHVGATPGVRQPGIPGEYVLRSVDGITLPAPLAGEDPQHKVRVTSGVLVLRPDGTYVCRTVGETSYLGYRQAFTDSLSGNYAVLQSGAISLAAKGVKADTIRTYGFQIVWSHPVRTWFGRFLYSR